MKIKKVTLPNNDDIINIVTRNSVQHNMEDEILHILTEEELPMYDMKDDVDRSIYIKRYDSVMNKLKYIIAGKLN